MARSGLNGISVNGCFHTFGGEYPSAGSSGVFPNHEMYDPITDKWTRLPDIPVPVHGVTGLAYINGWINYLRFIFYPRNNFSRHMVRHFFKQGAGGGKKRLLMSLGIKPNAVSGKARSDICHAILIVAHVIIRKRIRQLIFVKITDDRDVTHMGWQ